MSAVPLRPINADHRGTVAARSVAEVAKRLAEHEGRNDVTRNAEILRWCEEAAGQFDDARIQTFVPILIEHIVNNRIHEVHHDEKSADRAEGSYSDKAAHVTP